MTRNDPVHIGTYALRGAIAAMAMTGMRVVTVGLNLLPKDPPEEIFEDALPQFLELVPREYLDEAIELAHWGYGAVGGATFALLPAAIRRDRWSGPAYGIATVDGRSSVERDDCGTCFNLDLAHRGRQVVELRRRKIGEGRKCGDPTRIRGPLIVPHGAIERDLRSPASCRYVAAGPELAAAVFCDGGDGAKTRADLARVQLSPAPRTHRSVGTRAFGSLSVRILTHTFSRFF